MTSELKLRSVIREKIKLSVIHRNVFYSLIFLIWITGCLWLLFDNYISVSSPFGIRKHWAQSKILWMHGIIAYGVVFILGTFLIHVKRGLALRVNYPSGLTLIIIFILITISGLGLYYVSSEQLRDMTSILHWILGLILPFVIAAHIFNGRKLRNRG